MADETTAGILDLIDAAIGDHQLGPDAVRYNAVAPPIPRWEPGERITFSVGRMNPFDYAEPPRVYLDGRVISVLWARAADRYVQDFSDQMRQLVAPMAAIADAAKVSHSAIMRTLAVFGVRPCAIGGVPCFCHQEPFPAAQDYRRRTKHRRRRGRR